MTRASIAAQAAGEDEAARQKAELVDQVAQLTAKIDAQAEDRRATNDSVRRLQTDLAAARDETETLKRRFAESGPTPQTVVPEMTAPDVAARLRDDLDGARRGEATLRQENAVLQRELIQAKQAAAASIEPQNGRSVADGRSTDERSAALRKVQTELDRMRAARARDAALIARLRRQPASLQAKPSASMGSWISPRSLLSERQPARLRSETYGSCSTSRLRRRA